MKPKVVTFDCANTLVRVRWTPGGFALDCARAAGLELGEKEREVYERILRVRWPEYQEINKTRDPARGDAFWEKLAEDWLEELGHPTDITPKIIEAAPDLLYGSASEMFVLFDDILPTLDALDARGIRLGVISNWDYSLHRVLKNLGVHHRFEFVIASLEEGVEKPDPRLFELTLEKFGVLPSEVIHVGDDPVDDVQGASGVGIPALLIDRKREASEGSIIARMTDLLEAW
jgi:putative hydrolase of the HAD superfamily